MGYCFGPKLVVVRFLKNKNRDHTPYDRDYSPGLSVVFRFRAILPWGFIFSEVGPLVFPQLIITIAFYDLNRCSGSIIIISFPIPHGLCKYNKKVYHLVKIWF